MINMIDMAPVLGMFPQNVLKTREMLIRFPFLMLNLKFGEVPISPQMISMINKIKIYPVLATFWKENWLTWLTWLTFLQFVDSFAPNGHKTRR